MFYRRRVLFCYGWLRCSPTLRQGSAAAGSNKLPLSGIALWDAETAKTRNIGIVAHIDAGKTTTTERMLFYAGVTKRIGDVDSGTTTTDYMQEEMDRGITITSAAVSLRWQDHAINLIDTPGHVDFTVEVERALRVVDGVVALFDASAGVQAQSYTVLRQARKFHVPVIAFLNKMDKSNADFNKSVKSIREKLQVDPLLIQIPIHGVDGAFEGVVDVVEMKAIHFKGKHGEVVEEAALAVGDTASQANSAIPAHVVAAANTARHDMMHLLTSVDDALSEKLIEALDLADGDEEKAERLVSSKDIRDAIRRCVCSVAAEKIGGGAPKTTGGESKQRPLMPILCGASRRDQGVQPLLNAVNDYLPSPIDRKNLTGYTDDGVTEIPLPVPTNRPTVPVIALAFKVIHAEGLRGSMDPLVFFRVYSGRVTPRMKLMNFSSPKKVTESLEKLFVMHANTPVEVPALCAGSIGAAFLPNTCTGDTLIGFPNANMQLGGGGGSHMQQQHLERDAAKSRPLREDEDPSRIRLLEGIQIPPPAISFSIEAATTRLIPVMEEALARLSKEDPSLRTSKNDFGQLIISGMGELHLEIILSRLQREYQLNCKLLRAIIEYRETLVRPRVVKGAVIAHGDLPLLSVDFTWMPTLSEDLVMDAMSSVRVVIDPECEAAYLGTGDDGATMNAAAKRAGTSGNERSRSQNKIELEMLRNAFRQGLEECARLGPRAALPLIGIEIRVTSLQKRVLQLQEKLVTPGVRGCLVGSLRDDFNVNKDFAILEPMMAVEVHLTEATYIGEVISSLNERNALTVDILEDGRSVSAIVPMRNIVRYTTDLRKSAKGNASFFTKLHHYRVIEDKTTLGKVLKNLGAQ